MVSGSLLELLRIRGSGFPLGVVRRRMGQCWNCVGATILENVSESKFSTEKVKVKDGSGILMTL